MQRSSALEVVFRCRLVISPNRNISQLCCSGSNWLVEDIHLLSAVDESLLDWGNPLLLFDTLLYPGNLIIALY
jgi:hypothetical protein